MPCKIKLPRETVFACERRCRRSRSFSHHEHLDGKRAIIYCTDDNGEVILAFMGIVTRVSNKARKWALHAESMLSAHELHAS